MRQRSRCDDGFTLIELMVVVLIIGVLIAIAIPVFAGSRQRAEDRASQEDIRTGLAATMTFFAESGTYSGFGLDPFGVEPGLAWLTAAAPTPGQIDIERALGSELLLITLSRSGTFFCLSQQAGSPLTDRGRGAQFADVDTVSECTGGW